MRFDTRLVHVGQQPVPGTGAVVPPIHLATTYDRTAQDPPRYFYARGEQPNREALEECLAALEDARHATVYTSGQAAATTALSVVPPGRLVLASDDVYGGTHQLLVAAAERGVTVRQVDLADPAERDRALSECGPELAMVWLETPTNPLLKVADIAAVSDLAHRHGALVVVDNTLAGPVLQRPLAHGADITLYSTTKSVAGHLDVLGGALVYQDEELHQRFLAYRTVAGNAPGGFDCYLTHRGLKTLSLRTTRQVENTRAVVAALLAEPSVDRVSYPGLPAHPQHAVAARQMTAPGALAAFEYRGDPAKLLDRVRLFTAAVSLGGVRSLIECPALMTHRPVPPEVRRRLGLTDRLIRISPGIEDPADLVEDLVTALRDGA
ncbi:PLP-dependent aspartate aminotransferase family protein [Micromonospora sp. B006]|uniref:trans-sulfuration enzyme family protein n=1 Tax=Micromonospora sp. B006 TaxID=2201999 RepID=UPI000E306BC2|nr:PLP-dependent aspartate aminotransferase family protein [Micromonospora sp. B006]AXO37215.1 cystathionine gamma-lyase [Micromonospora sp. B006]